MSEMKGYPDSYYAATAVGARDCPALDHERQADVCVIGGGFTGLSAALNLAERGLDVVLLEAERIGFGASGRCGGLIGSGQRQDVIEAEEAFGLERSKLLWDLAEDAKQEIRDRVASNRFLEGLYDSEALTLHPLNYSLGLARAGQDNAY